MTQEEWDLQWETQALQLARQAEMAGEVPVGAVIVKDNEFIASAYNQPLGQVDPTAHAEILAMRCAAQVLQNYRLVDCELFVSLEPCTMCAAALVHARIKRVVFSTPDPKAGAVCNIYQVLDDKRLNHQVAWQQGSLAKESSNLLKNFFQQRRS